MSLNHNVARFEKYVSQFITQTQTSRFELTIFLFPFFFPLSYPYLPFLEIYFFNFLIYETFFVSFILKFSLLLLIIK